MHNVEGRVRQTPIRLSEGAACEDRIYGEKRFLILKVNLTLRSDWSGHGFGKFLLERRIRWAPIRLSEGVACEESILRGETIPRLKSRSHFAIGLEWLWIQQIPPGKKSRLTSRSDQRSNRFNKFQHQKKRKGKCQFQKKNSKVGIIRYIHQSLNILAKKEELKKGTES